MITLISNIQEILAVDRTS